MNNFKNVIWGLFFVAIGIILGGNVLGIFDINIFFSGWWTLFIIIPSFIGIVTEKEKIGSCIFFLIGVVLLLSCRGLFDLELVWKLLLPAIIIAIGLSMIFKNTVNKEVNNNIKKLNENINSNEGYTSTFSGQTFNLDGEEFKGTNLNAVFGGLKLDLRKAIINNDVVINASSIFGGIDIFVPDGYKVKVKSNSIFGGVSNDKDNNNIEGNAITIYVNAIRMFGGVQIK